ncbi:MAG: AsmA family protein, partial [Candidatus Gastranaerophilales bacterium]|nr:AsmA family protein [Candidatus Gastranaerophilales bacterium]
MNKKLGIILGSIIGIIIVLALVFKFALPQLIDLNKFLPEVQNEVKKSTDLDLNIENIRFETDFGFGITVFGENISLKYPDNSSLMITKNVKARIALLPLLFKNIKVTGITIDSPEIYFTLEKNGKYKIQQVIEKIEKQEQKEAQDFKIHLSDFQINNYKILYLDKTSNPGQSALIKGDELIIDEFNPEKIIKMTTKGQVFINGVSVVNYDLAIESELPSTKEESKPENVSQPINNPLKNIFKYDFSTDIKADLKIKELDKLPKIYGNVLLDKFLITIKGKKLPQSRFNAAFDGHNVTIDSNFYIDLNSFFDIKGNLNIGKNKKFDIAVKSTDIDLNTLKNYGIVLAEIAGASTEEIKKTVISGIFKSDFKIKSDLKKADFKGFIDIKNASVSYKGIAQSVNNINSHVDLSNDKINITNTYGYINADKFTISGNIDNKNNADIVFKLPSLNFSTIETVINKSSFFKELKTQTKDFYNYSGNVGVMVYLKGKIDKIQPQIILSAQNAKLVNKPLKLPITLTDARIEVKDTSAEIAKLTIKLLNSTFSLSGNAVNIDKQPKIDIKGSGAILAIDLKHFADKSIKDLISFNDKIPVYFEIRGVPDKIYADAQLKLPQSLNLIEFARFPQAYNVIGLSSVISPESLTIFDSGLYPVSEKMAFTSNLIQNISKSPELISIRGKIDKINTKNPVIDNLNIATNNFVGINSPALDDAKTSLNSKIVINGSLQAPKAEGNFSLQNTDIPLFSMKSNLINGEFSDKAILLDIQGLNLDGSIFNAKAEIDSGLKIPYKIRKLDVDSSYIDADKLAAFAENQPQQANAPWMFVVEKGTFNGQKIKSGKINVGKTFCNFVVNKNGVANAFNLDTNVFGGQVLGKALYDIPKTVMIANVNAKNIDAGVFAQEFLQMPKFMSGTVNANVNVQTQGTT